MAMTNPDCIASAEAPLPVATARAENRWGRKVKSFTLALLVIALAASPMASWAAFSNMYVFGDSLSDNGNLYGWTDAPNPVTDGNPIPVTQLNGMALYSQGRFQNGESYSELLWSGLRSSGHLQASGDLTPRGLKPGFPPGLNEVGAAGTNYAVGGARSRYHRFDLGTGLPQGPSPWFYPFSLRGQFEQFNADLGGRADPNALYVVWSGSNDLADALQFGGDPGQRIKDALEDLGAVLVGLVNSGARNLLVPNLPDLGLVPEVKNNPNPSASDIATALSEAYNDQLGKALDRLRQVPAVNLYDYDTFGFLRLAAEFPADFGFTNTADPCLQGLFVAPPPVGAVTVCGNPDEYLFWDTLHPSAKTHELLALGMLAAIPEPGTTLLLGIGLVAYGLRTRRKRGAEAERLRSIAEESFPGYIRVSPHAFHAG